MARGPFLFVLRQRGGGAGGRPGCACGARWGPRRFSFLAPRACGGELQPVFQRRGGGRFGLGHGLPHFQCESRDPLSGPRVTHGGVLAGVGQHFGAGGGDGELAHLPKFALLGPWEHWHAAGRQKGFVFPAQGADRVVIGVGAAVIRRAGTLSRVRRAMRRRPKAPGAARSMSKARIMAGGKGSAPGPRALTLAVRRAQASPASLPKWARWPGGTQSWRVGGNSGGVSRSMLTKRGPLVAALDCGTGGGVQTGVKKCLETRPTSS